MNPAWAGVILKAAKAPLAVDFFDDEDDETQPRRGARPVDESEPARGGGGGGGRHGPHLPHPHGGPPASKQQARARQIAFLIGAVVVLILLVIAFRGCMNARKDRSFENYVSDLSAITADTAPLSDGFFSLLDDNAGQASEDIGLQNQVNGDAGAAQGLLDRARGLDAPDELGSAQEQIVLSYELRHDALVGIASHLDDLSGGNRDKAIDAIYTQMKVLSASDILFARARDQIEQALADEEIVVDEGVPESQFLPANPNYLEPSVTEGAITGASVEGTTADDTECKGDGETHGMGLVGSTLLPSGTALVDGGSVTAPDTDDTLSVDVQNQGTTEETDVEVSVSGDVSGSETIDSIGSQETQAVEIPLESLPKGGATIEVEVATVGCEQVADNNSASYTVTF